MMEFEPRESHSFSTSYTRSKPTSLVSEDAFMIGTIANTSIMYILLPYLELDQLIKFQQCSKRFYNQFVPLVIHNLKRTRGQVPLHRFVKEAYATMPNTKRLLKLSRPKRSSSHHGLKDEENKEECKEFS